MSDLSTPLTPEVSPPNPAVPTTPGLETGTPEVVSPPAGFVPQSEVERVEAQRRSLQGELDRIKAAQTPAPTTPPTTDLGSDPVALRSEMFATLALMQGVPTIQSQFPHADAELFSPELLMEFGSVEALRLAAEESHNRVATLIKAATDAKDVEFEARLRELGVTPPLGAVNPGDPAASLPTVAELSRMSTAELDEFERNNPGKTNEILASAMGR